MEKEEIIQLCELREKLLKKATELKNSLKHHEENRHQSSLNFNVTLPPDDEDYMPSESLSSRYKVKLCEISSMVTGITFKDVNKEWLRDNVYIYSARVVTKTITLNLELTVVLEDTDDFKINNIKCDFVNVDDCHRHEIFPWFEKIRSTKNFSFFISAFSDYDESNNLRSKILQSLESKKYANVVQNTEENEGIYVYVHSIGNTSRSYLLFHWILKFIETTWHVEHFFTLKPTDRGIEFFEENSFLLKEFCKKGLTKDNLIELWDRLCIAIDTYDAKNTGNT